MKQYINKTLFQYSKALLGKLTNTLFTFTYIRGMA